MTTPKELESLARRGDATAFGELIRLWDDNLRGVVWAVVRSASDVDDVMQSAYEKAFRSVRDFRGDASLKTWMHSICYRAAIDHLRYEGTRAHGSDRALLTTAASESTSDDALARTELTMVLAHLTPEQRGLVLMVAGLGFSFDEVAQICDLPRGTVASKVGRARKAIREFREAREIEE